MKRIIFILSVLPVLTTGIVKGGEYEPSDFFNTMQSGDKAAILMVHFGTTHDDTRALTIEALNNRVKQQFADTEIREAYTSRIIIKRLGERGIVKPNPVGALKMLYAEGFTHILIQPSTVIDGVEMEAIRKDVEGLAFLFKDIRVGKSLLYAPQDYKKLIDALTEKADKKTAYIAVGHGTYDVSTAQYAMLDYMLKAKGHANFFVGTIEGYPAMEDVMAQLKASGLKKVVLLPLMFVAGEHAKNDIAGDWKDEFEQAGYRTEVRMEGLGQNPKIQDVYIEHLRFAAMHREIGIINKKAIYEKTGEKMK